MISYDKETATRARGGQQMTDYGADYTLDAGQPSGVSTDCNNQLQQSTLEYPLQKGVTPNSYISEYWNSPSIA